MNPQDVFYVGKIGTDSVQRNKKNQKIAQSEASPWIPWVGFGRHISSAPVLL